MISLKTHQVMMYLAGDNSEIARLTSIEKEPFYQIEGLNLRFAPTEFLFK